MAAVWMMTSGSPSATASASPAGWSRSESKAVWFPPPFPNTISSFTDVQPGARSGRSFSNSVSNTNSAGSASARICLISSAASRALMGTMIAPRAATGAEQREELGTVPGQDGDSVPPADPPGSQRADDGMGLLKKLFEGDPALFGLDRHPLPEYTRVSLDYVVNGETAQAPWSTPLSIDLFEFIRISWCRSSFGTH